MWSFRWVNLPLLFFNILTIKRREVSTEDGKQLAAENGLLFVETSALSSKGVQRAFEEVAENILEKLKKGIIDPKIEVSSKKFNFIQEFGVRQVAGASPGNDHSSGGKKSKKGGSDYSQDYNG